MKYGGAAHLGKQRNNEGEMQSMVSAYSIICDLQNTQLLDGLKYPWLERKVAA
jgi:hypothetical protein